MTAVRHQAITWANVDQDPWRHVASLGHNELNLCIDKDDIPTRIFLSRYLPTSYIYQVEHGWYKLNL